MMPRRILQERRVRAIAAVHASIGASVIVSAIAGAAISLAQIHGNRNIGAIAIPIIAGLAVLLGAIFMVIAWLLWIYNPIAKWITALLLAGASALCIYDLIFTTQRIFEIVSLRGADSDVFLLIRFVLIGILVLLWSAFVLVALLRPDSRELFSAEYRESIRAERAIHIPFYSSPYFVMGLVVWLIVGLIVSWTLSS